MGALGAYHGINPAMGWLFAVSLGMQDGSRRAVLRALGPIAVGHEISIALVAGLVIGLRFVAGSTALHIGAAAALTAFGIFRFVKPRAHFRWTKMRVSQRELTLWSFLMSTAHGAGLMVAPVLIGAGLGNGASHDHDLSAMSLGALSLPQTALAVIVHVAAMVVVMGAVAVAVYQRLGLAVLRRAWINSDHVWAAAFVMAGAMTLVT
jgi:hypothetical protein